MFVGAEERDTSRLFTPNEVFICCSVDSVKTLTKFISRSYERFESTQCESLKKGPMHIHLCDSDEGWQEGDVDLYIEITPSKMGVFNE